LRTLDDIRALGGNDAADERCFATADRISQMNLALYRTFAQPFVRSLVNPSWAEWMRQFHPLRLQYEMFSDANPAMKPLAALADKVRSDRRPVEKDNPLVALQENVSRQIVSGLDAWREAAEAFSERAFFAIYSSPTLQAAAGVNPSASVPLRRAAKSVLHQELVARKIADFRSRIPQGGIREAVIRGLLFAGMGRAAVDERGFETMRRIRESMTDVPLSTFKSMVREQFYMLLLDTEGALAAIPSMLPDDLDTRKTGFGRITEVLSARGEYSAEDERRVQRVAELFGVESKLAGPTNFAIAAANENPTPAPAKAS
jgi:hypothetical protein